MALAEPIKRLQCDVRHYVEAGSAIFTDELHSYDGLDDNYKHAVINHAIEYANGEVHTNTIENFWSLLKRGLHGTYVSVEPFHLFRYLDEQAFRYNNRKDMNDGERFSAVVSQIAGKRLTYTNLTGKVTGGRTDQLGGKVAGNASRLDLLFRPASFWVARCSLPILSLTPRNLSLWHS
jgi:transposase-like protein